MSSGFGMLALRASYTVGSMLAPRRTARRTANMWFSVPRRPVPPPPDEPPGGAVRMLTGDRGQLRTRSWGMGPIVCFVHGWGGNGDQVHGFVGPLVRRGLQVATFDAPGHGGSTIGDEAHTNAVETAAALRILTADYGPIHSVIAHSLGAVATMIAVRRRWVDAERFALIAPVSQVRSQLDRFADALAVWQRARAQLDAEVRRHTGLSIDDFAYRGGDPLLGRTPMVAVHDRDDSFVSYRDTAALVASWPEAKLITIEGLGHEIPRLAW